MSNKTKTLENTEILMSPSDPGKATVSYHPDPKELQTELREGNHPLQFVMKYEIDRSEGSELELMEGYFVHFVAPENLTPIPRHVVFILDTSGRLVSIL